MLRHRWHALQLPAVCCVLITLALVATGDWIAHLRPPAILAAGPHSPLVAVPLLPATWSTQESAF